ncbi:MAG: RtcB family protein, partial [Acidobacteriota bacterium]|nr:RtcB family protein [Acidobacteriota bacterium]
MTEEHTDAKALKVAKELKNAHNWKHLARWHGEGYYELHTEDTSDVPVRLFLTKTLLDSAEDILYRQIVNATRFPGVRMVVITPDTHYGYGVPVGCVLITDAGNGAVAMGPVGYDIGCFTADTLVPLVDGRSYPIGELAESGEEFLVYSISEEQKIVVAKATARKTRTNAPLVKVRLDNGKEIFCTPDHELMLRDGSYRAAHHLTAGTSLMPFQARHDFVGARDKFAARLLAATGGQGQALPLQIIAALEVSSVAACGYNHKVISVELLDERADVFCLTVPEYGNFALDAGVFVHNCGMMSARSNVEVEQATAEKRLEFNRAVMERVDMGAGGKSIRLGALDKPEFNNLVRGGAEYYVEKYGATFDRSRAERHRIPVDDSWQIPWGGKGRPERGLNQLGSLGSGNHFIELQRSEQTGTLFVQVHTGSRGFGHG